MNDLNNAKIAKGFHAFKKIFAEAELKRKPDVK
jgi:hypothetical protein